MQRRRITLKHDNDEVSQFIWRVRQRPALYNYKLAPQERRRVDVAKIWQEVAEEIGGRVTAGECRKKWKNLRDTYHQYRLRKSKFKGCLEKWRYSKDLEFLADIYQPKLKSERSRYTNECSASNNVMYKINEVKISSIASLIDVDEVTNTSFEKLNDDALIENDYDDNIEHVVNMDEVQFCDVQAGVETNNIRTPDEAYSEVCLYDEGETSVVAVDFSEDSNYVDTKHNINRHRSVRAIDDLKAAGPSEKANLTIGNNRDELDLFFQFLKTKIQKLPSADITAIQIEFLNAVLRKETANTAKI